MYFLYSLSMLERAFSGDAQIIDSTAQIPRINRAGFEHISYVCTSKFYFKTFTPFPSQQKINTIYFHVTKVSMHY